LPFVRIRLKSLIRQAHDFEPQTLGDHIRRRRLVLSLTQEETAEQLGVNAWTVHNWETGATKPAIQFIPALVSFLGYDPEPVEEGSLAGRLVAKRRLLGLSQREAARTLHIDPGTWAVWELGARIAQEVHRRAVEAFLDTPGTASQPCSRSRPMMERSGVPVEASAVLPG
jgi:DNA-binding transcriptional regulator YiaG